MMLPKGSIMDDPIGSLDPIIRACQQTLAPIDEMEIILSLHPTMGAHGVNLIPGLKLSSFGPDPP